MLAVRNLVLILVRINRHDFGPIQLNTLLWFLMIEAREHLAHCSAVEHTCIFQNSLCYVTLISGFVTITPNRLKVRKC